MNKSLLKFLISAPLKIININKAGIRYKLLPPKVIYASRILFWPESMKIVVKKLLSKINWKFIKIKVERVNAK